jgi:hypothetical protein
MEETDVRNALARRLQKSLPESSTNFKLPNPTVSVPKSVTPEESNKCPPSALTEPLNSIGVRVEGYLYKYSSGHLGRWQKRFFVLEAGRFAYYKRVPSERDPTHSNASKSFSIRRIKSVCSKGGLDDREFTLIFSNGKGYQMRAPTNEDMHKWVSSLRSAIVYFEAHGDGTTGAGTEDGGMSDEGADGLTSANGSVISESSPRAPMSPSGSDSRLSSMLHGLVPRRESLTGVLHLAVKPLTAVASHIPGLQSQQDAPILEVEIDPDQLDKNFEEWFYFIPMDQMSSTASTVTIYREIRMSHVIEACSRVVNHLFATLASLPRGAEVKIEEALGRAQARIRDSQSAERATIVVEEYVSRLTKYVSKCLDIRSANLMHANEHHTNTELPQIMDTVVKLISLVDRVVPQDLCPVNAGSSVSSTESSPTAHTLPKKSNVKCVCCYCDPSGVAILKLERQNGGKKNLQVPPVSCSNEKWKKGLRTVLQRIGGELEVGLIEEMQGGIAKAEAAWQSPGVPTKPTTEDTHGPCPQNHALFEDLKLSAKQQVLLSSFAPLFIQNAQTKCLNASSQWMVAYPLAARLISEHTSSALVASVNCVWRHFKREATSISEQANEEVTKKYTEAIRSRKEESLRNSKLDHLISFSNECILISLFCAKTWSNAVTAKFTPEVFMTCMDGLSSGFLVTAADVCNSIVKHHFYPLISFDLHKMFGPKNLSINHATPMTHAKNLADRFVSLIDTLNPLPCVREGVVSLLGPACMKGYLSGVIRNKPKLKTFKTVPEMIKDDLELWREIFAVRYKGSMLQLTPSIVVGEEFHKILIDKNRLNFSIHFNTLGKLIGSLSDSFHGISAVVKMREHEWPSSAEKKDISNMLSSMKAIAMKEEKEDGTFENSEPHLPSAQEPVSKKGKTLNTALVIQLPVGDFKDVPWKISD